MIPSFTKTTELVMVVHSCTAVLQALNLGSGYLAVPGSSVVNAI